MLRLGPACSLLLLCCSAAVARAQPDGPLPTQRDSASAPDSSAVLLFGVAGPVSAHEDGGIPVFAGSGRGRLDLTSGPRFRLGPKAQPWGAVALQIPRPPTDFDLYGGGVVVMLADAPLAWSAAWSHSPRPRTRFVLDGDGAVREGTDVTSWSRVNVSVAGPLAQSLSWNARVGYLQTDLDREDAWLSLEAEDAEGDLWGQDHYAETRMGLRYARGEAGAVSVRSGTRLEASVGSLWGNGSLYQVAFAAHHVVPFGPLSGAVRAVFSGSYGEADGEPAAMLSLDDRFGPAYVRGYAQLSEGACTFDPSGCAEQRRLDGSQATTIGAEVRAPVAGPAGPIPSRRLPTEIVVFAEAGAAWSTDQPLSLRWSTDTADRVPVASVGLAVRSRLLGRLPLELHVAFPLQRPEERAVVGFLFTPLAW